MNDWNIQTRARACQSCARAFADKAPYHTLLFEMRSGLERLDICAACWEAQHRHGSSDRKGFVSHWQGVFSVPPPAPPDPIQRESAESLLRRLTEANEPAWQAAAFILAVMLERKRVLKSRELLHQEGRRVWVYELPRTGEVFTIGDPGLHLDQLQQVQRDVSQLLERGLEPARQPASPPAEAPGVTHDVAEAVLMPDSASASPEVDLANPPP